VKSGGFCGDLLGRMQCVKEKLRKSHEAFLRMIPANIKYFKSETSQLEAIFRDGMLPKFREK
jgi:hypothetical protein